MKTFEIIPVAAARPRVTKRGTFYPEKYANYKKDMKLLAKSMYKTKLEGAVRADIAFYMPFVKGTSKVKCRALDGTAHIKKPDADNLIKGVLDALNGVAYDDDSQVSVIFAYKKYSYFPRIEITLRCL